MAKSIPVLLNKEKVTLRGRFIYSSPFEPIEDDFYNHEYSACILIDKKDTQCLEVIQGALQRLGTENLSLKDMDLDEKRKDNPVFAGKYLLRSKSKNQPDVIDLKGNHLTSDEFYNGCYGYVTVVLTSYSYMNEVGVTAYLNNIMKVADGEPLGISNAVNDFKSFLQEYECYENPTLFIENTLTSMGVNGLSLPDGNLAIENTQE